MLSVKPAYLKRVNQFLNRFTNKSFIGFSLLLSVIHVIFFFLSDYNSKVPIENWVKYRFGVSIIVSCMLLLGVKLKKHFSFILLIELIVFTLGMSYQSYLGYPLRIKWVIWVPFLILAFHYRSLLLTLFTLNGLTFLAVSLWQKDVVLSYMRGDLIFCNAGLLLSHFIWRFVINNKVQDFKNMDIVQETLKEKVEIYDELKSFVSPVLVEQLEKDIKQKGSIHLALDSVMQRRECEIAILYTDFRDYSTRSTNNDFVENELIPTSTKLLDQCEENKGIGRLIGDNVMVFYQQKDPEESVIRGFMDCILGALDEDERIKLAKRTRYERYFILTFGRALVGNMGSNYHRDVTIVGDPINLAARIDDLTKNSILRDILDSRPHIILDKEAACVLNRLAKFEFITFDLKLHDIIIRSYEEVNEILLLPLNKQVLETCKQLAKINNIDFLQLEVKNGKIPNFS